MKKKKCRICLKTLSDEEFPDVVRRSKDTSDHVCTACAQKKGLLTRLVEWRHTGEKECAHCHKVKCLSQFPDRATAKDGKSSYCYKCYAHLNKTKYRRRNQHET